MFWIKVRVRVGDFLSFVTVAVDFDRNGRASLAMPGYQSHYTMMVIRVGLWVRSGAENNTIMDGLEVLYVG